MIRIGRDDNGGQGNIFLPQFFKSRNYKRLLTYINAYKNNLYLFYPIFINTTDG